MTDDPGTRPRTISSGDLGQLLNDLLEGWVRSVGGDASALSDWKGRTEQQVTTMMTLTAHVHSTAMILRPVLPDGLTIAHMPLVRSIYEATITAVWCDEVADGANALINEGSRQRHNLRGSLAATRSMAELASKISVGVGSLPTSSEAQARRVEARCSEVALDGAYALYRMLSGMGHASIDTIDAYLDGDSFVPGQTISVKSNPGVLSSSFSWSHLVACCLMWSGRVVDYLDPARTRRSDLRRAARMLCVEQVLPVTYTAHHRGKTS